MIRDDGMAGIAADPGLYQTAVIASRDYREALRQAAAGPDPSAGAIADRLMIDDVCRAADLLRPLYDHSERRDGLVSFPLSPRFVDNTVDACNEARRLWRQVDRPNLLIGMPATREGLAAAETLMGEGLSIDLSLVFSLEDYEAAAEAFLRGIEALVKAGGDPTAIASVATVPIGPVDTLLDAVAAHRLEGTRSREERRLFEEIRGQVGIASARIAYRHNRRVFAGERWERLRERGARPQRLRWAGIGAADPEFSNTRYVEELLGRDTIATLVPAACEAFRDHGRVAGERLAAGVEAADQILARLAQLDIPIQGITRRLRSDSLRRSRETYNRLIAAIDAEGSNVSQPFFRSQACRLPAGLAERVGTAVQAWSAGNNAERLWSRDGSLWTGGSEPDWLGWLSVVGEQRARIERFGEFADEVRRGRYRHLAVLGMGGSSLCPEVLARTFSPPEGRPQLHVLDATDPDQVRAFEGEIDPEQTLFFVSSKSGRTLEPNLFFEYFFARVAERLGPDRAGRQFVAVTDPGSPLEAVAERHQFGHRFHGVPSIGGRFSALSDFGMMPAAAAGLDVGRILERAAEMVEACAAGVPADENPGVALGALLGTGARQGRDKVTLVVSPGLAALGAWLEQLLAESTGKNSTGLIPIEDEPLGRPEQYGNDRIFIYLRLESASDPGQEAAIDRIEVAGHPVVRIPVAERYDIGQEFFRWQFATAVAGSILGIDPFDQPDVEASKVATRELTRNWETRGAFPVETPIVEEDGIAWHADRRNAADLGRAATGRPGATALLRAHLARLGPGDYFALLAFIEMQPAHRQVLQEIRRLVRDATGCATSLGFGPRYLHSTGQVHKGGPNSGLFLMMTADGSELPVPGRPYGFGVVRTAQARGDFQVLAERERRLLRADLGAGVGAGLEILRARIETALGAD